MAGNRYTENEIILCTYIARFGRGLINEDLIRSLFDRRPVGSVKMKVRNIARMLSEEGYRHSQEVSPWGGGHRTDWHIVQLYADWAEPDFTARVKEILARRRHQSGPPRERDHQPIPDMLRQSEGFERVHESLGVFLIATPRDNVRVCHPEDSLAQVRSDNTISAFDYLPVEEACQKGIVGLLAAKHYACSASEGDEQALVRDCMCPLSEADLIGEDATILDFIMRVRRKPLLVVAGERIQGLVAWSDLQKLPVRAAIFALLTGFELTMYEAIKELLGDDGWQEHLGCRLKMAENTYADRTGNNSEVDLLLCTQFCDKSTILRKHLPFGAQPELPMLTSKGKFKSAVKKIEELRNSVAHANSYAMCWGEVEKLKQTVKTLIDLREYLAVAGHGAAEPVR